MRQLQAERFLPGLEFPSKMSSDGIEIASAENKQQEEPISGQPKPWEGVVPYDQRTYAILGFWKRGDSAKEIGMVYKISAKTVYNILYDLREKYGEEIAPNRKPKKIKENRIKIRKKRENSGN